MGLRCILDNILVCFPCWFSYICTNIYANGVVLSSLTVTHTVVFNLLMFLAFFATRKVTFPARNVRIFFNSSLDKLGNQAVEAMDIKSNCYQMWWSPWKSSTVNGTDWLNHRGSHGMQQRLLIMRPVDQTPTHVFRSFYLSF